MSTCIIRQPAPVPVATAPRCGHPVVIIGAQPDRSGFLVSFRPLVRAKGGRRTPGPTLARLIPGDMPGADLIYRGRRLSLRFDAQRILGVGEL